MTRYYNPPRGRPKSNSGLTKNHKIALGAVGVAVALGAVMVVVGEPDPPETQEIIWVAEKTTVSPGVAPTALRERVHAAGDEGGARLTA